MVNAPESPMPLTKIMALFGEFPWLEKYIRPRCVDRIFVKRVDVSLLTQHAEERVVDHHTGTLYLAQVHILDAEGNELVRLNKKEVVVPEEIIPAVPARPNKGWFSLWKPTIPARPEKRKPEKRSWETLRYIGHREKIQDAIVRLAQMEDRADKGFFIVSVFTKTGTVVIYKAPKGYDLVGWFRAEEERERQALRAELDQIDAVADQPPAAK